MSKAVQYLRRRCRVMRRLIGEHGSFILTPDRRRSPFEALVRAVAHQQLNGTAAESILRRFRALFPSGRFPRPQHILDVPEETLRTVGFSRAKIAALRDIAEKTISGLVPNSRQIQRMSDDEIVERLTQIRGVGRWTAEMLLIFKLGRADVFPVDDFGVRNGCRIAFELDVLPSPKQVLALGEAWRPYRSTASWYLWRAVDGGRTGKKA